ncbi:MAG: NfeD family protein [Acidobacteria bacterium]|nr:NfeD family protein [Acidobacteriota bacterium]
MTELIQSLSAFAVFLSIAAFGFLFLLISLIFGELFEHLGGIDHDISHDMDHGGPSFFSPRILSVFITAFGGAGAIGSYYGLSTLASSGLGFVSGTGFAYLIFLFARFLYGQQATTELKTTDVVGQTARVVVGIPKDGVGQVRCRIGEELVDKVARSQDGEPIPENTAVHVEQALGEIVVVKRC